MMMIKDLSNGTLLSIRDYHRTTLRITVEMFTIFLISSLHERSTRARNC